MIRLEHVSRTFREKNMEVRALQDVSLHVRKGEIYGIVGFSGAGKSTLIRLVNRLETPDSGTVRVNGQELAGLKGKALTSLRRKIGMVFQQFNLLEGKTVFHNISIPLRMEGRPKEEIERRVSEVLDFVELGDKKEALAAEDLPFIVADVLKTANNATQDNIHIVNYSLQLARGMRPAAVVKVSIHGEEYEAASPGDGQYDAFMKALWIIYDKLGKKHPVLTDYQVTIPPGGKTDALVSAIISWKKGDYEFKTRGIDSDQTEAAIKATVKMLNIIENMDLNQLK